MTKTNYKTAKGMHMHQLERELLVSLAKKTEERFEQPIIVNIGIAAKFGHCSMRCLREGSPNAYLIGIDIKDQGKVPQGLDTEKTVFFISDSSTFLKEFPTKIHMAFVDGNHSKSGVEKDIKALLPLMEKGSFLAFHDYGHHGKPGFEHVYGVKKAVDKGMGGNQEWAHCGDVVSIRYFERVK